MMYNIKGLIFINFATYILYFVVCLLASAAGSISGVGGGVMIKPMFDAITPMDTATINFLSACAVLSMAIVSTIRTRKGGVIPMPVALPLAIGSAFGGIAGAFIFSSIRHTIGHEILVGVIQSSIFLIVTLGIFIYTLSKSKIKTKNVTGIYQCVLIGLVLGIISSFLGIGGGPINIAVLYYFFSMEPKKAARTSLFIIIFSQIATLSFIVINKLPQFSWLILAVMILGSAGGALFGGYFSKHFSEKQTARFFIFILIFIMFIGVYNIIDAFI